MSELIELLNQLKHQATGTNEALWDSAFVLTDKLNEDQQVLKDEVERLGQIISDIRERDARKNCICRGY